MEIFVLSVLNSRKGFSGKTSMPVGSVKATKSVLWPKMYLTFGCDKLFWKDWKLPLILDQTPPPATLNRVSKATALTVLSSCVKKGLVDFNFYTTRSSEMCSWRCQAREVFLYKNSFYCQFFSFVFQTCNHIPNKLSLNTVCILCHRITRTVILKNI